MNRKFYVQTRIADFYVNAQLSAVDRTTLTSTEIIHKEAEARVDELLAAAADEAEKHFIKQKLGKLDREGFIEAQDRRQIRHAIADVLESMRPKRKPVVSQIPFDADGDMIHKLPGRYDWDYESKKKIEWRNIIEFTDTLEIVEMYKGLGAKYIVMRSCTNEADYPMFAVDFFPMIRQAVVERGVVKGRWGFVKRYSDKYGITYLGEDNAG